jgi:hypothetical protein
VVPLLVLALCGLMLVGAVLLIWRSRRDTLDEASFQVLAERVAQQQDRFAFLWPGPVLTLLIGAFVVLGFILAVLKRALW